MLSCRASFRGTAKAGRGGGGESIAADPLGRLLCYSLACAGYFLVIFYRARVLEISPFSLAKTVSFYAIADHATLDVCLLVWVKLFSFFIFPV